MTNSLTNLYVYKDICLYGYTALESVLSTIDFCDEALLCVDPTSDSDTLRLVDKICKKYPKAWRLDFKWPDNAPGDGSKIGIATQYAYDNARTTYTLNVQADEVYPPELSQWIKTYWGEIAEMGVDAMRFKVLHTEFDASQYQGGNENSTWDWQSGAGYSHSFKLWRKCPAIRVAPDGWSVDGASVLFNVDFSEEWPIVHLHDFSRDHYIALRRNAADNLWTDRVKYGHYNATANTVEATKDSWMNNPGWTQTVSQFDRVLHPLVRQILGRTKYETRWELLE